MLQLRLCKLPTTLLFLLGSAVRTWVADLLLSEEYYNSLNENRHYGGVVTDSMKAYHKKCFPWLEEAVKVMSGWDSFSKSYLDVDIYYFGFLEIAYVQGSRRD